VRPAHTPLTRSADCGFRKLESLSLRVKRYSKKSSSEAFLFLSNQLSNQSRFNYPLSLDSRQSSILVRFLDNHWSTKKIYLRDKTRKVMEFNGPARIDPNPNFFFFFSSLFFLSSFCPDWAPDPLTFSLSLV
jgi:hypothetical protein